MTCDMYKMRDRERWGAAGGPSEMRCTGNATVDARVRDVRIDVYDETDMYVCVCPQSLARLGLLHWYF